MPETIGSESLVALSASAHYSASVNNKPGEGDIVDFNPPRFSWSYTVNPSQTADNTVKEFRFKISPNSKMSSPVVDVVTESNCYNRLAPLTPGGTYYWQIEYRSPVNVFQF